MHVHNDDIASLMLPNANGLNLNQSRAILKMSVMYSIVSYK